jgi:hypothetical protein
MQGQEGLDEWVLQPGVKESLSSFMQQTKQYRKMHNGNLRQLMYRDYGTTYYYEFFFLQDITYY